MSFRLALRSLPRPASSTSRIGQTVARQQQQQRCASSHAISNPTLANIEKRWEAMPPQEQADLWMALRDRMKVDWNEMTMNEKKAGRTYLGGSRALTELAHASAILVTLWFDNGQVLTFVLAYWVAFGPHGPRALPPPGENWKVFRLTMYGVLASLAIFLATRSFARGPPRTMTKEYQEATNEYMKEHNIEPITGVSSEGYVGKGQVQTDRSSKDLPPLEE
ncbi:hypothetical protein D0864_07318 [Hortaea werneckii]|uniref:Cytochrome c oxidase polypeptide 5, mitochondrial n=2 Tax=Hortaea werneckii TaxID=91943 RepID=A0A3M7F949_HORWE|nr:hypothetical protein D0864_07318 [Hortaea werneckii]